MSERICATCPYARPCRRHPDLWCPVLQDWRGRAQGQCRLSEAERAERMTRVEGEHG